MVAGDQGCWQLATGDIDWWLADLDNLLVMGWSMEVIEMEQEVQWGSREHSCFFKGTPLQLIVMLIIKVLALSFHESTHFSMIQ